MSKFKVGDKVRVLSDPHIDSCGIDRDVVLEFSKKIHVVTGLSSWGSVLFNGETARIDGGRGLVWNDALLELAEPRREFIVIRRDGAKTIAELRHDREVIKSGAAICNASDTFDFDTGAKLAFDRLMGREEPKPAPNPAHRFKVGDRVFNDPLGIFGTVDRIDEADAVMPYHVKHEQNGYWWAKEHQLSPAPAPEPPKFYTGKVVCVEWKGDILRHKNAGRMAIITNGISDYDGWNRLSKRFESFSDFCSANYFGVFHEIKE